MNLNRIRIIADQKKIQWSKIAEVAELASTEGLNYAIERETLKARAIEHIAKTLEVSVLEFFENNGNTHGKAEEPGAKYGKNYARTSEVNEVLRKVDVLETYLKDILKRLPAKAK